MKFWVRGEKLLANSCLPSLSHLEKGQEDSWTRWLFPSSIWSYLFSLHGPGGNNGLRSRGWRYCRVHGISAHCPPGAQAGFGLCRWLWMQSVMLWPDRLGSAFACFQHDANSTMRYAGNCPKLHQRPNRCEMSPRHNKATASSSISKEGAL